MSQPAEQSDRLIHSGPGALVRLAELGVPAGCLDSALDAGDVAARDADHFSPVMAAGVLRWLQTVRRLREILAADGWQPTDDRNVPRIVSPDGSIAIAAMSGNAATGKPDTSPRPARPRGPASARSVEVNGQLLLPLPAAVLPDMAAERSEGMTTWFLLYHRAQDELRAELSLPVEINELGVVKDWAERIVLPPRLFGPEDFLVPRDADGDDGVDFVISSR